MVFVNNQADENPKYESLGMFVQPVVQVCVGDRLLTKS